MTQVEDVGERRAMIEAGDDVVRRLRATADDIEKDVAELRGAEALLT